MKIKRYLNLLIVNTKKLKLGYRFLRFKLFVLRTYTSGKIKLSKAKAWNKFYWVKYSETIWWRRHKLGVTLFGLFALFCLSLYPYDYIYGYLKDWDEIKIDHCRELFLSVGGALIGATVLVFSFIMFAMQINVERLPIGLFSKFSTDLKLLGVFGSTFLLSVTLTFISLGSDSLEIIDLLYLSVWIIITIFVLFIYAYQRAMALINPLKQLQHIKDAVKIELNAWIKRFKRAKPLYQSPKERLSLDNTGSDLVATAYFKINHHWANEVKRAINHCIAFSRQYTEYGDYEVSATALNTIISINQLYVQAKGNTFYSDTLFIENPLTTDNFINDTLEHLRQNIQVAISRKDEKQIEQNFNALAYLVQIYLQIKYATEYSSKTHAHLASSYLMEGIQSVAPHNMPDILMKGIRLISDVAKSFLILAQPNDIVSSADKIALIGATGIANESHRPVLLTAVQQLTNLTGWLLSSKHHDLQHAMNEVRQNLTMLADLFLKNAKDKPLMSTHSTYLKPYYSCTGTFITFLTEATNKILQAQENDLEMKEVIGNIEDWADGIYQPQKELLLLAIKQKSFLAFDIIRWDTHVVKLLLAISTSQVCDHDDKENLERHANWLASTLTWIPRDKETVATLEGYQMTEVLFEMAVDAYAYKSLGVFKTSKDLLLTWGIEGGRHQIGWAILERSVYALATLALLPDSLLALNFLKQQIIQNLAKPDSPTQEIRDRAARDIREKAETLYRRGHWSSSIEHEMSRVDRDKLKVLLHEIANILSPDTTSNHITP